MSLQPSTHESAIARLLSHHYGEGVLYLPRELPTDALRAAIAGGFLSEEGYITRKGRALLARVGNTPISVGE